VEKINIWDGIIIGAVGGAIAGLTVWLPNIQIQRPSNTEIKNVFING